MQKGQKRYRSESREREQRAKSNKKKEEATKATIKYNTTIDNN
jgi:hypothetical protein